MSAGRDRELDWEVANRLASLLSERLSTQVPHVLVYAVVLLCALPQPVYVQSYESCCTGD